MPTTLVTGATGFVGSHVARALVARGDDVRVTVRATSNLDALAGLDVRDDGRRPDRPAGGAARAQGRLARLPRRRLDQPARLGRGAVRGQRAGRRGWCWRSACGRTSSASCTPPRPPRSARRRRAATADERTLWRGGLGIPYVDAKHEAEVEALRIAARGLPVVVVCPAYVLGRGRPGAPRPSSCGASCCGGSRPTSRARSTWSTSRTWRRACCSPTPPASPASATSSATATTRGTACSPISRGCRGSSRRPCGSR